MLSVVPTFMTWHTGCLTVEHFLWVALVQVCSLIVSTTLSHFFSLQQIIGR